MLGFLSVDGCAEPYLFRAWLRPGLAKEIRGTMALLRRTVKGQRKAFKRPNIRVRLDAGFGYPELFGTLDELGVEYVVAIGRNSVLAKRAERHMSAARSLTEQFRKATALFGETRYRTRIRGGRGSRLRERRACAWTPPGWSSPEIQVAGGPDSGGCRTTPPGLPAEEYLRIDERNLGNDSPRARPGDCLRNETRRTDTRPADSSP